MRTFVLMGLMLLPGAAYAEVVITEVMYDVEGSDTNREWVEIQNTGSEPIDLTDWKFFEANTNHKLTPAGSATLSPGGYALIVQNPDDWGSASFPIFDASFSLGNDAGETLEMHDPEGNVSDSITYDLGIGAAGDGNSLQRRGSSWISALPTPGSQNATQATSPPASPSSESSTYSTPSSSNPPSSVSAKNTDKKTMSSSGVFSVDAGSDREITAGSEITFSAEVKNKPASSVSFSWNLGNGVMKENPSVIYRYDYPGDYVVTLIVKSGDFKAEDRFTVKVNTASVGITLVTSDAVEIKNLGKEADLGGWTLRDGVHTFVFPQNSIILPGKTLTIPHSVSGLKGASITLFMPNGKMATLPVLQTEMTNPPPASVLSSKVTESKAPEEVKASISKPSPVVAPKATTNPEVLQAATPLLADSENASSTLWYWISGLFGIVALAGGAIFMLRSEPQSEADLYTIIEKKEK